MCADLIDPGLSTIDAWAPFPLPAARILSDSATSYDLLVAACGYETRSRHVAQALEGRVTTVLAYSFSSHRRLAYRTNRAFFRAVGTVIDEAPEAYEKDLRNRLDELIAARIEANSLGVATPRLRIAVDISSMDRDRIARTLRALFVESAGHADIDFYYSIAKYQDRVGSEGPIWVNRPIEHFEGWSARPDLPTVCVVGAGFEGSYALGALEQLEPVDTFVFLPYGEDERYDRMVASRNRTLLSSGVTTVAYDVREPFDTLVTLEGLVHRLVQCSRVVLIPLGPKIFALASLLVALGDPDDVAVWRLSPDVAREPHDRYPSGRIVGVRMKGSHGDG